VVDDDAVDVAILGVLLYAFLFIQVDFNKVFSWQYYSPDSFLKSFSDRVALNSSHYNRVL